MSTGENERLVSAGISEVFSDGANGRDDFAQNENKKNDGEETQGRRRDKRNRRGKRRGRGNSDKGDTSAESSAAGAFDRENEKSAEDDDFEYDDSIEFYGAGGFDDYGHMIPETGEYTEVIMTTDAPETVEVVGVRFRNSGKTYYFSPAGLFLKKGEFAVVETSRGLEFCTVSAANTRIPVSAIVPPLRSIIRKATEADILKNQENLKKEKDAFAVCLEKIRDHRLDMKLIEAEYTFDQSKLTFYFSAAGRVDFRELVKDLAGVFRTRIELRQIGIRDEAKLVGGLGVCGQPFCCSTFLSDFTQVSIKMAKEQNLSLNSAKISGSCGRLMCCLRFENDTYAEEKKLTPPVGSIVKTADGEGEVVETTPLRGKIKVRFGDETNQTVREYRREDVTVLRKGSNEKKTESAEPEKPEEE